MSFLKTALQLNTSYLAQDRVAASDVQKCAFLWTAKTRDGCLETKHWVSKCLWAETFLAFQSLCQLQTDRFIWKNSSDHSLKTHQHKFSNRSVWKRHNFYVPRPVQTISGLVFWADDLLSEFLVVVWVLIPAAVPAAQDTGADLGKRQSTCMQPYYDN